MFYVKLSVFKIIGFVWVGGMNLATVLEIILTKE